VHLAGEQAKQEQNGRSASKRLDRGDLGGCKNAKKTQNGDVAKHVPKRKKARTPTPAPDPDHNIHLVLFGMQNRTLGPYLAAINRTLNREGHGQRTWGPRRAQPIWHAE
jgi:hypothetical protein